ncbi:phospholipid-transporting ATPase ABCA3-like isoform X2 [Ptychodera flava]|uniref:phospholipid-transporting ATPase ABCA3-like isoform X2 n=1 Tax=Ptychodera flava TaxID=63121 RepID=UPI00396A8684
MCMRKWKQFCLLLWKNFILQIRRPIGTFFEIAIPVACVAIIIVARDRTNKRNICFETFEPSSLQYEAYGFPPQFILDYDGDVPDNVTWINSYPTLGYYPHTSLTDKIMSYVAGAGVAVLNKSEPLEDIIEKMSEGTYEQYLGVVVFDLDEKAMSLPTEVSYKLRPPANTWDSWNTDKNYPAFGQSYSYYTSTNFLEIQNAVDKAIIAVQLESRNGNSTPSVPVQIRKFPFPSQTQDPFLELVKLIMPILFCVAFIYTAGIIVKELVLEKHDRLKESMKMMGMTNEVHWLAWFTKSFVFSVIIVGCIVVVLKFANIYPKSDASLILVFFLLWLSSAITWNFAVATCLSRPKLAVPAGMVLWFLNFFPVFFINTGSIYSTMTWSQKASACLLCNTCMGIGINLIAAREVEGVGAQWSNIALPVSIDDDFTLAAVFGFFVVDLVVYTIIAWQVEAIFPGKYGVPKPFYFSCMPSYWCPSMRKEPNRVSSQEDVQDRDYARNHEAEPNGMNAGISITNLKKVYSSFSTGSKLAVDNLSLNMYEGQITSLLGHNGAGKTTTMSILTGLFPPTSGTASVNGYSILTDIDKVRYSLGLCPQHNVLFDRLTVKEHLEFFVSLKGKSGSEARRQVEDMIRDLNLTEKTNEQSQKLSGGMKRKLSCGIALVGDSKIVILDEPTSGMDPYSRRGTWDLLLKHKQGRTILLTTHFMDEADFLGDRIAIMANGQLVCSGSSLFLKNRFGVGYHMTLVKTPECKKESLDKLIKNEVPDAECTSDVGRELSYTLPKESTAKFKDMFQTLEGSMSNFGIDSYGISVTTMEEVFMKVGEGAADVEENGDIVDDRTEAGLSGNDGNGQKSRNGAMDSDQRDGKATPLGAGRVDDVTVDMQETDQGLLTGCGLLWQQFKAMFVKKFINSKRDKMAIITQVLLPLIFIIVSQVAAFYSAPRRQDPPRLLELSNLYDPTFGNSKAYIADFRQMNFSSDVLSLKVAADFLPTIKVDSIDVTDDVWTIFNDSKAMPEYPAKCCDYPQQVINQQCMGYFQREEYKPDILCSNSSEFGYKHCLNCLLVGPPNTTFHYNDGCASGYRNLFNDLSDMNVYYQEFVLRESNPDLFFNEYVAGITVTDGIITAWYSGKGYHTTAEAVNAVNNIILQTQTNASFRIHTTNHPLPRASKDDAENKVWDAVVSFSALMEAFLIVLGLGILAASFLPFIIQEKKSKAKHVQIVSGLNQIIYWLANFVWDYINYLVIAIIIVIIIAAFDKADLGWEGVPPLIVIMLLFGWAMLPFVYLASFIFTGPVLGYFIVMIFMGLIMSVCLMTVHILKWNPDSDDGDIADKVFLAIPSYTVGRAIQELVSNGKARDLCTETFQQKLACARYDVTYANNTFDWDPPGLGKYSAYLFFEGVGFFLLVLLCEYGFFIQSCIPAKARNSGNIREDEDVAQERKRVETLDPKSSDAIVLMKDLTKVYRGTCCKSAERPAVDSISLAVPKGECFGLLGINGAGKTTTFSMLTGELSMTAGSAYIDGHNIRTSKRKAQQHMGYCPQFDALIDRLTGRELLTMYARLRGIPDHRIDGVVKETITNLDLDKWADKLSGQYSGGNKRKLSTASAVVGDPTILFLDEPTTGMDPKARRALWNALLKLMREGRSIILTSHSMEECEALCTRLVIMVNGQFKCLGSTQHLKSRFGRGYTIILKVEEGRDSLVVKQHIPGLFRGAILMEEHQGMLQYQIDSVELNWSNLFGIIEERKQELGISEYSISQTSLEQVFLNFAKEQHMDKHQLKQSMKLGGAVGGSILQRQASVMGSMRGVRPQSGFRREENPQQEGQYQVQEMPVAGAPGSGKWDGPQNEDQMTGKATEEIPMSKMAKEEEEKNTASERRDEKQLENARDSPSPLLKEEDKSPEDQEGGIDLSPSAKDDEVQSNVTDNEVEFKDERGGGTPQMEGVTKSDDAGIMV